MVVIGDTSIPLSLDFLRDKISGTIARGLDGVAFKAQEIADKIASALGIPLGKLSTTAAAFPAAIVAGLNGMLGETLGKLNIIPDSLREIVDGIEGSVGGISLGIATALIPLSGTIKTAINSLAKILGINLDETMAKIAAKMEATVFAIRDFFADMLQNVMAKVGVVFERIWEEIKVLAEPLIEDVRNFTRKIIDEIAATARKAKEIAVFLTEKISKVITDSFQMFLDIVKPVFETLEKFVKWVLEEVAPTISKSWENTTDGIVEKTVGLRKIQTGILDGNEQGIREGLSDLLRDRPADDLSSLVMLIGAAMVNIFAALTAIGAPAIQSIQQRAFEHLPTSVLTVNQLGAAWQRGHLQEEKSVKDARKQGLDGGEIAVLKALSKALPTSEIIRAAFLRGEITEIMHDRLLVERGFDPDGIKVLKSVYDLIPPPQDLILMAVREVFSPEIAEKFGQFEDFPPVFAKWAKKQGLTEEWAKNYWAAHWKLPSSLQGFEMLHRGVIDEGELDLLLRALDFMPFWRDRLKKIAFRRFTRVDVRRMEKLGVLSEDEIKVAYQDLGYDKDKAEKMKDFTLEFNAEEERGLTRTQIAKGFVRGVVSREEAVKMLKTLGYNEAKSNFILTLATVQVGTETAEDIPDAATRSILKNTMDAYKRGIVSKAEVRNFLTTIDITGIEIEWHLAETDYERISELKALKLQTIQKLYVRRIITLTETTIQLGQMNLSGAESSRILGDWEIIRESGANTLSKSEIFRSLRKKIITQNEAKEFLKGLGIPDRNIEILIKLNT